MDPDSVFANLRQHIRDGRDAETNREAAMHFELAADAFDALDDWLRKGGFPPHAWNVEPSRLQ